MKRTTKKTAKTFRIDSPIAVQLEDEARDQRRTQTEVVEHALVESFKPTRRKAK